MEGAAIEILHPKVKKLIKNLGWDLTPIQEEAVIDLCSGENRLLVAPTGSGKLKQQYYRLFQGQLMKVGKGFQFYTLHHSEH